MSGSNVHEAEFTVRSELGLHARPAGQFVVLASRFASEISVGRGVDWVDGRSVLSLLSLAASRGTKLRIRAVGPDAQAAVEALGRVLEEQGTVPPRPPVG
ncbi:MAG TPA: HPr family phosphocarrier protein [Myxococcota bacterium]